MEAGMVWSAALSSRLPGSPVAVNEGGVISDQPKSPRVLAKVVERNATSPLTEEMKGHFFELKLLTEYKLLGEQKMSGVYVLPSQQSLCEWHGVLFIHDGPWKGGIYRFSILIPDEYPQMRPMFRFRTRITHPYVKHKNGQVNLYRVMPEWDPAKSHLYEVVSNVRHSFLSSEVWQLDDKEEEKELLDSFRRCAIRSAAAIHKDQDDTNGPENLLRLFDSGDTTVHRAREMIHAGVLPTADGRSQTYVGSNVLGQLSAQVSHFIGKVIGE